MYKKVLFKGIAFYDVDFKCVSRDFSKGILVCFPSGPGLSTILSDQAYHKALKKSDMNLFDSGLFVILLKLKFIFVKKFSGFVFIKKLLNHFHDQKISNFIFVDPNAPFSINNSKLLLKYKIHCSNASYIAPKYDNNNVKDYRLLKILERYKPKYIILNIGGGIQEKLGAWLKDNLRYKANIICTGAAISFLTKDQAPINKFFDTLYLGWLVRCLNKPSVFIPRYLKSLKLIYIFFKPSS